MESLPGWRDESCSFLPCTFISLKMGTWKRVPLVALLPSSGMLLHWTHDTRTNCPEGRLPLLVPLGLGKRSAGRLRLCSLLFLLRGCSLCDWGGHVLSLSWCEVLYQVPQLCCSCWLHPFGRDPGCTETRVLSSANTLPTVSPVQTFEKLRNRFPLVSCELCRPKEYQLFSPKFKTSPIFSTAPSTSLSSKSPNTMEAICYIEDVQRYSCPRCVQRVKIEYEDIETAVFVLRSSRVVFIINLHIPLHGVVGIRRSSRHVSTKTCLPKLELIDVRPNVNFQPY